MLLFFLLLIKTFH